MTMHYSTCYRRSFKLKKDTNPGSWLSFGRDGFSKEFLFFVGFRSTKFHMLLHIKKTPAGASISAGGKCSQRREMVAW